MRLLRILALACLAACSARAALTATDATLATVRQHPRSEPVPPVHEVMPDTAMPREREPQRAPAADPDQFRGPTAADLARARLVARELAHQAAHDARSERCPEVVRASYHVEKIDADVFAREFMADTAIQICMSVPQL